MINTLMQPFHQVAFPPATFLAITTNDLRYVLFLGIDEIDTVVVATRILTKYFVNLAFNSTREAA